MTTFTARATAPGFNFFTPPPPEHSPIVYQAYVGQEMGSQQFAGVPVATTSTYRSRHATEHYPEPADTSWQGADHAVRSHVAEERRFKNFVNATIVVGLVAAGACLAGNVFGLWGE